MLNLLRLCRANTRHSGSATAMLWRDASGTAILEFAIIGPAFIALLTGVFYVAIAFLTQQGLETAAGRRAIVHDRAGADRHRWQQQGLVRVGVQDCAVQRRERDYRGRDGDYHPPATAAVHEL